MPFAQESGYTPSSIETLMDAVMLGINSQFGTTYTTETFAGTNFYKYFYAIVQELQENDVKTSEIFAKLQEYIVVTNQRISRPVVTNPGLIEKLETEGFISSIKPMIDADAGKISICVDVDDGVHAEGIVTITSYANLISGTDDSVTVGATVFTAQSGAATLGTGTFQAVTSNAITAASLATQINAHAVASLVVRATAIGAVVHLRAVHGGTAGNSIVLGYTDNDTNVGATKSGTVLSGGAANADYAATKLEICTIIKDSTAAGTVTQGTETEDIVLSNGQSFTFKYFLPHRIEVLLRLTITLSENNQVEVGNPDALKALLIANIAEKYRLGRNFEPQRYFSTVDAPWASQVLLEWSQDEGASYYSTVFDANFDDLFEVLLENITLVEL